MATTPMGSPTNVDYCCVNRPMQTLATQQRIVSAQIVNILRGLAGVRHPTCYDELTSSGGSRPVPHPSDTSTSAHSNIARVNRVTRLPRRYHSLFTRTPCGNDHYRPRSSPAKVREQALGHVLSSTQDQCHDPTCSRSYWHYRRQHYSEAAASTYSTSFGIPTLVYVIRKRRPPYLVQREIHFHTH